MNYTVTLSFNVEADTQEQANERAADAATLLTTQAQLDVEIRDVCKES